jgi:hypothetical protein
MTLRNRTALVHFVCSGRVAQICLITIWVPHLRDSLIVAKVGIRVTRELSSTLGAVEFY